MKDFTPEVNSILKDEEEKAKMSRMEDMLSRTREKMNKDLDEKVARGEIDEHEAREHYFMMMMLTAMVAR